MAEKLDYLVVYGDSYSDIHNGTKRTNGPVWSERLAKKWNTQLLSYATSGSTICKNEKKNGNWLKKQVGQDITLNNNEVSTIHMIFIGITDVLENIKLQDSINCIKEQVSYIDSKIENSKIIIMGLPALEFSPYAASHDNNLKDNIMKFNVQLEEEVLDWDSQLSNDIKFFDTYLVFSDLLGDPSTVNIENVDNSYWDYCQGKCLEDINNYLWYDNVHITGSGHKAISNIIQSKNFYTSASLTTEDDDIILDNKSNHTYFVFFLFILLTVIMVYLFKFNRVNIQLLKKKISNNLSKLHNRQQHRNEYTLV